MTHAGHDPVLSGLRGRIAALDRSAGRERPPHPFGVAALDRHLPWGGLPLGALHEFCESALEAEHAAAATLFVAGILARRPGPVLWCLRGRDLFAPALAAVGLGPDRVVYVETWRDAEVLPAMEEGLRHGGLAGVVGEAARLSLVASRRLQLAAEATGVPAFCIRRWRSDAERAAGEEPNGAWTRWRVAAAPSATPWSRAAYAWEDAAALPGLARPRWLVELLRCRGGAPRSWTLEACDAEGRLALPPDLADRPPAQEGGPPSPVRTVRGDRVGSDAVPARRSA